MELAIGLIVLVGIAYILYVNNKKESATNDAATAPAAPSAAPAPEAPYKIETPVVQESAPVMNITVTESVKEAKEEKKPRKPRATKAAAKKPAAKISKGKSKKA